jgi:hypothetical protein
MNWHIAKICPRCRWSFQCPIQQYEDRILCRACEPVRANG